MQYGIQRPVDVDIVRDVILDERKILVSCQMRNIISGSRDQIVHADDLVAFGQKSITQVRPQKTSRAGDQNTHDECAILALK